MIENDTIEKIVGYLVRHFGTDCIYNGNGKKYIDDIAPGNQNKVNRRRIKATLESGALNTLKDSDDYNDALSVLKDYTDWNESVSTEVLNAFAKTLGLKTKATVCNIADSSENGSLMEQADNMIAMIKGSSEANLFISVPVSERLKDLINHPTKVEDILDSLKNFGGKCLPVYEELKNLWELSKAEASVFSDIQVKLLMDFNSQSHTDENVSYWKQMLEKVKTGSAQVENEFVKYSSFPIFSSCVAAIQKHIERLLNQQQEDLIREQERIAAEKAEKEKQRKKEEERRKGEEKRKKEKQLRTEENVRCLIKGILVGVGIFALLALIGWALTFVETVEIFLTVIASGIAIFLCIIFFYVLVEDLVYPICLSLVIAVVLGFCIFLIWSLEIGTGVAEFMTANFKEFLKWSGIGSSIAAVIAGIFFKCR